MKQGLPARLAVIAATLVLPLAASAQSDVELATRRTMLEQAQAARRAGDHVLALDLAQRAGQVQMTPSVRFFIAEEQAHTGRLAEAVGSAEACARDADRDTAMHDRTRILAECRALGARLRPLVGFVTLHADTPLPPDARITLNGAAIGTVLLDVPVVASPGTNVIDVTRGARTLFHATVTVAARETHSVHVRTDTADTHPPVVVETPVVSPLPVRTPPPAILPLPHPTLVARGPSGATIAGAVGAGLGGAGIALGVVGTVVAQSRLQAFNASDSGCGVDTAGTVHGPSDCRVSFDTGNTWQTVSIAGYAVGGALLVGSIALLAVAQSRAHERRVGFVCAPGVTPSASITCGGAF